MHETDNSNLPPPILLEAMRVFGGPIGGRVSREQFPDGRALLPNGERSDLSAAYATGRLSQPSITSGLAAKSSPGRRPAAPGSPSTRRGTNSKEPQNAGAEQPSLTAELFGGPCQGLAISPEQYGPPASRLAGMLRQAASCASRSAAADDRRDGQSCPPSRGPDRRRRLDQHQTGAAGFNQPVLGHQLHRRPHEGRGVVLDHVPECSRAALQPRVVESATKSSVSLLRLPRGRPPGYSPPGSDPVHPARVALLLPGIFPVVWGRSASSTRGHPNGKERYRDDAPSPTTTNGAQ